MSAAAYLVFDNVPAAEQLPDEIVGDLQVGILGAKHLTGQMKTAVRALTTVASLDAPVWIYETKSALEGEPYIFATGAIVQTGWWPKIAPAAPLASHNTPDTMIEFRRYVAGGIERTVGGDRACRFIRLPAPSKRKVAIFSAPGLVRLLEESRLFPERQVPDYAMVTGRKQIVVAWRARQNG